MKGIDTGESDSEGDGNSPGSFPSFGSDIKTEHQCPSCGYKWSGKSQATQSNDDEEVEDEN